MKSLVQTLSWHQTGDKPLPETMITRIVSPFIGHCASVSWGTCWLSEDSLVLMSWDLMLWAHKGDMWVCLGKGVYHTAVNINQKCCQVCWHKHIQSVDLFSKSHNAKIPCPKMHHTKWCIVGYLFTVFWDLWDGSLVEIWCIQYEQWNIKLLISMHWLANNIAMEYTLLNAAKAYLW